MTKREALIKKIATYQFAAHDLQLYLDTHPGDSATIEQMQRYEEMAAPLIRTSLRRTICSSIWTPIPVTRRPWSRCSAMRKWRHR